MIKEEAINKLRLRKEIQAYLKRTEEEGYVWGEEREKEE